MGKIQNCTEELLEELRKIGMDRKTDLLEIQADLQAVWENFRQDVKGLLRDLRTDLAALVCTCREMVTALAAQVKETVVRWIG